PDGGALTHSNALLLAVEAHRLGGGLGRRRGRARVLFGREGHLSKRRRPGRQAKRDRNGKGTIQAHAASYRCRGEYRLNDCKRRFWLTNSQSRKRSQNCRPARAARAIG